ncbi:hypothetical protein CEQ90_11460 [Lewinellaceae bacterium SD302]|nr:hypothetical protein CEQ90_11460 [Lewinellaceae bacterium SD302]
MKANFTRHLAELDEDQLRHELNELYGRFDNVRDYYKMELAGDTEVVVTKYKKKIHHCFFPGRGRGKRARSQSRALIKEFRQISIFPADVLELEIHRTQAMVDWIIKWYNESDAYFNSLQTAFEACCKATVAQQLEDRYQDQLRGIAQTYQGYRRRGGRSLEGIYLRFF